MIAAVASMVRKRRLMSSGSPHLPSSPLSRPIRITATSVTTEAQTTMRTKGIVRPNVRGQAPPLLASGLEAAVVTFSWKPSRDAATGQPFNEPKSSKRGERASDTFTLTVLTRELIAKALKLRWSPSFGQLGGLAKGGFSSVSCRQSDVLLSPSVGLVRVLPPCVEWGLAVLYNPSPQDPRYAAWRQGRSRLHVASLGWTRGPRP